MSPFDGIIGHETILQVLNTALHKPAHAYLFSGPRGVGKTTVAERFASALLKESNLDTHPDFVRLAREEGAREIVVKQVRDLLARMQLTSARGGYKIALIEQADRLNEEAANALLKAVEEPSSHTVYIFLAEQPDRLPATLRSRLVKMEFGRVPSKAIENWLANHTTPSLAPSVVKAKAGESRGCPGTAFRLAFGEEEAWHQAFDWSALTVSLLKPPLGQQLAVIEKITQAVESQPDPETAWHEALEHLMRALDQTFTDQPATSVKLGKGLSHAWRLVGSGISPRLALEWALIPEEAKKGRMIPRIFSV